MTECLSAAVHKVKQPDTDDTRAPRAVMDTQRE